jgi:hypothetical protein
LNSSEVWYWVTNASAQCSNDSSKKSNTDFRALKTAYEHRADGCLFCEVQTHDKQRIVAENSLRLGCVWSLAAITNLLKVPT